MPKAKRLGARAKVPEMERLRTGAKVSKVERLDAEAKMLGVGVAVTLVILTANG